MCVGSDNKLAQFRLITGDAIRNRWTSQRSVAQKNLNACLAKFCDYVHNVMSLRGTLFSISRMV